jgi:hypothetical protein
MLPPKRWYPQQVHTALQPGSFTNVRTSNLT